MFIYLYKSKNDDDDDGDDGGGGDVCERKDSINAYSHFNMN